MPIITLLTDFGTVDAYVGVMKGVILTINPAATIVDVTHQVSPQDVVQAAFILAGTHAYFPSGTVHVAIVDPGVGGSRGVLALESGGHLFLAPDNGLLTPIFERGPVGPVVRVENSDYFLKPLSRTFHGRDIFAAVGAHLSSGVGFADLGPAADPAALKRIPIPRPQRTGPRELVGTVVLVDRFGNLVTNIDARRIEGFRQSTGAEAFVIEIGKTTAPGLCASYDSVAPQNPLAIIGSYGYLEIAVNCGNARDLLQVNKGDPVKLLAETRDQEGEFIGSSHHDPIID